MASTISVVMILLGGLVMAVGYEMFSSCLSMFQSSDCSNPFSRGSAGAGAFGLYIGAIIAALGAVVLVGSGVAKLLRKL